MRRLACVLTLLAAALLAATASCARRSDDSTVRIGLPIDPSTLNPIFATQTYELYLDCMTFSGLTTTDHRGNVLPDLAEAVPSRTNGGISPDGLTITYRLRPALRWQDGKPLTADDVVFTLSAMRDSRSESVLASSYDNVSSAVASDPLTVVFHLKHRQSDALVTFFNNPGGAILPRHLLQGITDLRRAAFNAHPVGSGPYVVESWARGSDLRLRANHLYFRGSSPIERLRVEFLPDSNTRAFEALSGNLDLAASLDPSSIPTLRDAPSHGRRPRR